MVLTTHDNDSQDARTNPARRAAQGGVPVARRQQPPVRGVRGWRTASVQAAASTDSHGRAERQLHKLTARRQPAGQDDGWMVRGACVDVVTGPGADVFFERETPGGGQPGESRASARAREQMAKQICAACPVMDDCLRYALATGEPYGVWGGLTARERAQAHAAKATPACRARAGG